MKPPRFPINTAAKVRKARAFLGLDKPGLARALRLGDVAGRNTVNRYERDGAEIPGPSQLALEYLVKEKAR